MAFDKLCRENKKDSALRLAGCMLKHSYISLGIGDIDWEIDMAIRQCGGEPLSKPQHYPKNTVFYSVNHSVIG